MLINVNLINVPNYFNWVIITCHILIIPYFVFLLVSIVYTHTEYLLYVSLNYIFEKIWC